MEEEQQLKKYCIIGFLALVVAATLTPFADAVGLMVQVPCACAWALTVFCGAYVRVIKYRIDCKK